jgi:hypothetical protein
MATCGQAVLRSHRYSGVFSAEASVRRAEFLPEQPAKPPKDTTSTTIAHNHINELPPRNP